MTTPEKRTLSEVISNASGANMPNFTLDHLFALASEFERSITVVHYHQEVPGHYTAVPTPDNLVTPTAFVQWLVNRELTRDDNEQRYSVSGKSVIVR